MNTYLRFQVIAVLSFLFAHSSIAQTTLYSETFNSGSSATWTLNTTDLGSDPANSNYWGINATYNGGFFGGTTPSQPAAITGSPQSTYMHIQNNLAGNASFLGPATGDVFAKMNTAINTTGYTGVAFNFWFLSKGHNTNTVNYTGRVYYSVDGGNAWTQLVSYSQIAVWTNANLTNAAFDNQADLRFAFMWHQGGGSGAQDPCFAVDELKVTGTPSVVCPVTITNQSSTPPTCNGSNNGTITITATGATVYTINSGTPISNGTGAFTGLTPGTYTVSAGDGSCTTNGTSITITNPAAVPSPTASSNSPLCAGDNLQLNATTVTNATYNWTGPNNFSNQQNPTKSNVTISDAGTYTVIATVGSCNSAPATTVVNVSNAPGTPVPSSNSPVCEGATLNLTSSLVSGASYTWTGPNNFNVQNPSKANVTSADGGTYTVVASIGSCVSSPASVQVVVNPTPATPLASSNSPICEGDALNLSATGNNNATYNWTGPNSFANQQNPSLSSTILADGGTYTVIASLGNCSSQPATTIVTVSATPGSLTVSSNSPVCEGGTLNLTASLISGASYTWSGPNAYNTQNPTQPGVTNADGGTYTVVANIGSCVSPPATVQVTVNPTPAIPVASSNSPLCVGQTLSLNASGSNNASYDWTGPNTFSNTQNPTKPNVTLGDTGTYSVVATIGSCSSAPSLLSVAHIIINENPVPSLTGSPTTICSGDSTLICTSGFTSYLWNTGDTSSCVSAKLAGNYYVTVTDANGCSASSTPVAINTFPTPSVSISVQGDTLISFNASAYQWYFNNGAIDGATNSVYVATQSGPYFVQITDSNGCKASSNAVNVIVLGVEAINTQANFHFYPNPTSNQITLSFNGTNRVAESIEIIDMTGRIVYNYNGKSALPTQLFIDISEFANGVYLLKVGNQWKKFIKE